MNKFLGEMKGFKLRKVVQPPREKERGTKGAGGEMQDVLRESTLSLSLCQARRT